MTSLSSSRPHFLTRPQRITLAIKRNLAALAAITLTAFAAGYFFGG